MKSDPAASRVVIVGPRRVRQGIGEFVARSFAEAGADVCAVVATGIATARDSARTLRERYGIEARAYGSLKEALREEEPEIVGLCSPFLHHREQLDQVADQGAHCLCEKPLWWCDRADVVGETRRLVDRFRGSGKLLELVTQWPHTLPYYYELYPGQRDKPVERFDMQLGPTTTDGRAILDSMPHVLSMLDALVGDGVVQDPVVDPVDHGDRGELWVRFEYKGSANGGTREAVPVTCRFRGCPEPPRPASYGINGQRVDRVIELPGYEMVFVGANGRVQLEDPLKLRVAEFLDRVAGGWSTQTDRLVEGMANLKRLVDAMQNR